MASETKWDNMMINILQDCGDYDKFFDCVFGFLTRKTDFFTDMKKAETTIATAGRKNLERLQKTKNNKAKADEERKQRLIAKEAVRKAKEQEAIQKAQKMAEERAQAAPKQPEALVEKKEKKVAKEGEEGAEGEEEEEEDKTPPPPGNGAIIDKYTWRQTLHEVSVDIWLPPNYNKKDLKVTFTSEQVFVGLKGQDPIIDGKWPEPINSEDSIWTIERDENNIKYLHLEIYKWKTKEGWWKHVAEGEPEINTQKINPESSKLSDIEDPSVRSQVEKMMFDMRQKQMGKPTSEEQKKDDILKQFKAQHPEMDFSNVKMS